jgi:hypothetical protein
LKGGIANSSVWLRARQLPSLRDEDIAYLVSRHDAKYLIFANEQEIRLQEIEAAVLILCHCGLSSHSAMVVSPVVALLPPDNLLRSQG